MNDIYARAIIPDGIVVECPKCKEYQASISVEGIIACACGYEHKLQYHEGVRWKWKTE